MSIATLEQRLQVIDSLNKAYGKLDDLVINTTPKSTTDKSNLKKLIHYRAVISQALDKLITEGIQATAEGLTQPSTDLAAVTSDLQGTQNTIEDVQKAVDVTAQIISIVAKIVALVA
jgi:hypothetical protein